MKSLPKIAKPSRDLIKQCCSEGGNLNTLNLRMVVFVAEAAELGLLGTGAEGKAFHAVVVEGAYGVEVGTFRKFLELLPSGVDIEYILYAVEMLTHIVLMNVDS